jgi:hypothetical protein
MNDNEKFLSLVFLCCIVGCLLGADVDKEAYYAMACFTSWGLVFGRLFHYKVA